MYGNPNSRLARSLSSKYPVLPTPPAPGGGGEFTIPHATLIEDVEEGQGNYLATIEGYTPKNGDLLLLSCPDEIKVRNPEGEWDRPLLRLNGLAPIQLTDIFGSYYHHTIGAEPLLVMYREYPFTPEPTTLIKEYTCLTPWVSWSMDYNLTQDGGVVHNPLFAGDYILGYKGQMRNILTGTTETPPETWQPGDIYFQIEEV